MLSFSERYGFSQPKSVIQIDSMDDDLRNSLWNALFVFYFDGITSQTSEKNTAIMGFTKFYWLRYLKWPIDKFPYKGSEQFSILRDRYFKYQWNEVYDFIQIIANDYDDLDQNQKFMHYCNFILEQELSGYRFVSGVIARITSEEEISSIEQAIASSPNPVSIHLQQALALFSDRTSPDYRNSMNSSISALESVCRIIASEPKDNWGIVIKQVKVKLGLHPALAGTIDKMFGWASDADIRHGSPNEPTLDFDDAKLMLVSCSAFINYLISKATKAGMKLQL